MNYGVEAFNRFGGISLVQQNAFRCATYLGRFALTDATIEYSNVDDYLPNLPHIHNSFLDVTTENMKIPGSAARVPVPPLVFIDLPDVGSLAGSSLVDAMLIEGCTLLKAAILNEGANQTSWRLYFAYVPLHDTPWVRIFQPNPQQPSSSGSYGLNILDHDGEQVLFDSNQRTLQIAETRDIELGSYAPNGSSSFQPAFDFSWRMNTSLANKSILATSAVGAHLNMRSVSIDWFGAAFLCFGAHNRTLRAFWRSTIISDTGEHERAHTLTSIPSGSIITRFPKTSNHKSIAMIIDNSLYP